MSKRKYPVSASVKEAVLDRQGDCCAMCGNYLPMDEDRYFHADEVNFHHVIPDQTGDLRDPRDNFLGTAGNIVAICSRESQTGLACHDIAHAGSEKQNTGDDLANLSVYFAENPVPPFSYFRYACTNQEDFNTFVVDGMRHWERVFERVESRFKQENARIQRANEQSMRAQAEAQRVVETQQREHQSLQQKMEDFKAGRCSEAELSSLLQNFNSSSAHYTWKYEKKLVREYRQDEYTIVREYEITLKCEPR